MFKALVALDGLENGALGGLPRSINQPTIPFKILRTLYVIRQWNANWYFMTSQLPLVPSNRTDISTPRMLKCINNGQLSKCCTRMRGNNYNMGIHTNTTQSTISGVLLYGQMKSIGTLGLHNKDIFFETLVPLKTLRIHNLYLCSRVLQFIYLRTSHGTTRVTYDSTMMSLIDLKSQTKSLQSHVNALRMVRRRNIKSGFVSGKQVFLMVLTFSRLETI